MQVHYDSRGDLLYLRFDDEKQDVINRRVSDDVVLDIGSDDRLVGIEILDALKRFGSTQTLRQVTLEDVGLMRA